MQQKHVWLILLVIQSLTVLQAKGQETKRDSVDIGDSIKWKSNTEHLSVQPFLQQEKPVLWFPENDLSQTLHQKIFVPDADLTLRYLSYRTNDSVSSVLPMYPGLADFRNYGGQLGTFGLTDDLSLDYGAFINVQYGYLTGRRNIIFGGNLLFRYSLTNRLQLQTWGQYVTLGKRNDPAFRMRGLFPTREVGAGVQYDSGKGTKIKVGTEYKYDQNKKVWKPESGGKVLFNFK